MVICETNSTWIFHQFKMEYHQVCDLTLEFGKLAISVEHKPSFVDVLGHHVKSNEKIDILWELGMMMMVLNSNDSNASICTSCDCHNINRQNSKHIHS